MANKRVFYATKKAGIGPVGSAGGGSFTDGKGSFRQIHGLQSVGITTTFNLEQTFELGQLSIYENIEGIPDVSIDCEKVLDGYCPIYVLATSINGDGSSATNGSDGVSTGASLVGRSKGKADFCLAIHKDTDLIATNTGAGGASDAAESHVMMSGVFVNSVSYNVGIDGYATESVTLVGQDKVWHALDGGSTATSRMKRAKWSATDFISREESPLALTQGSGGVNRREDVLFVYPGNNTNRDDKEPLGHLDINGAVSGLGTVLPRNIPGVSASGTNDKGADGQFACHLQSFSCSTDFGREDIFELGRKGRFHRFVPFPTEVTCEMTVISASGDLVSATEDGVADPANQGNLTDETIRLHLREGLLVDLGKKNKLSSVSVTGGDAGGGNEEITYSYTNFNDFTVYHPQDPNHRTHKDGRFATFKNSKFTPRTVESVGDTGEGTGASGIAHAVL